MKRFILIFLFCFTMPTHPPAYANGPGDVLVLIDGQYVSFSEQEALARVSEQPFAQALGHALPVPPKTYRQIWQHRDGNTTIDAAIERIELNR